jgi:hypothetical protein
MVDCLISSKSRRLITKERLILQSPEKRTFWKIALGVDQNSGIGETERSPDIRLIAVSGPRFDQTAY